MTEEPTFRRERLPTKEQIESIEDIPSLEALQEDVQKRATEIRIDLEYKDADEEWAKRARSALAACSICSDRLKAQIKKLRKTQQNKDTAPPLQWWRVPVRAVFRGDIYVKTSMHGEIRNVINRTPLSELGGNETTRFELDLIDIEVVGKSERVEEGDIEK